MPFKNWKQLRLSAIASLLFSLSLAYDGKHTQSYFSDGKVCRVYDDGVVRDGERRVLACGIALVARRYVRESFLEGHVALAQSLFLEAARGTLLRLSGQKEFEVGVGEDDRAYVTTVEHY